MRILSIQSSVAYGNVGNSAATFPMQRLGHEVWPVLTVHFSNHTGYGHWRGPVFEPSVVADVVRGIEDLGVLGMVDAVLTGYQGSPGVAEVILDVVGRVRAANSAAVYCCDPVLGDVGRGMFVLPELPQLMRDRVLPAANILTPNAFELAFLAGVELEQLSSVGGLRDAVAAVRDRGPRTVLVTSAELDYVGPESISMLAVDDSGGYLVSTPRLPLSVNGAGDVTAALFLAHLSDGIPTALARVASSVHAILERTVRAGTREISLIQAQQEIADPACQFEVRQLW